MVLGVILNFYLTTPKEHLPFTYKRMFWTNNYQYIQYSEFPRCTI